jgi:hypothetical protein
MSTWQEFYEEIRDVSWPECSSEQDFDQLPEHIKKECIEVFGYQPGQFLKSSLLPNRVFPIKTQTACQLKWNWSTVFLTTEETASCHRTNHHRFNTDTFDFHNTPSKLDDRDRMLQGLWPEKGCDYCRRIEEAGGQSDRITNLDYPGIYAPPELDHDLSATKVTPRILEVYFDNTCNLKCIYCGPHFSSLWDAENKLHGPYQKHNLTISNSFQKSNNIESNKQKIFAWLREHGHNLTVFNILGGEPLYQNELDQCLDLFEKHPAPQLKLQIFTNLNAKLGRVQNMVERVKTLIDHNKLREFEITASLDCWGPAQEYTRFPLDLRVWETNFEYLLEQPWINLIVSSTLTPLGIKTFPDLLERISKWNQKRKVWHYQNSVVGAHNNGHLRMDIFGNVFDQDFEKALALKPTATPEEKSSRLYLEGIARQARHKGPDIPEIIKLFDYLTELDRRRSTDWKKTFPWLIEEFGKYQIG